MSTWAELNLSPATLGWSVINVMRRFGVTTRTAVHTAWRDAEYEPTSSLEQLPIELVDDGIDYLVNAGLATFVDPTITPTNVDADGKPSRLRRVPGDDTTLELLPPGEAPQSV